MLDVEDLEYLLAVKEYIETQEKITKGIELSGDEPGSGAAWPYVYERTMARIEALKIAGSAT